MKCSVHRIEEIYTHEGKQYQDSHFYCSECKLYEQPRDKKGSRYQRCFRYYRGYDDRSFEKYNFFNDYLQADFGVNKSLSTKIVQKEDKI